jgi:hypothetical protein
VHFIYITIKHQNQFGQTKKATSSYEKKAWQLYENKLKEYDIIESCLKPLGNLYTIIGDYENAENTIKHYFYIANGENNHAQNFAAIQFVERFQYILASI